MPKLAACMDEAGNEVLVTMTFPRLHWPQIYSTDPLERLVAEIERRANVVVIFANDLHRRLQPPSADTCRPGRAHVRIVQADNLA